jgi:uncharacterized protein (DUF1800 family)
MTLAPLTEDQARHLLRRTGFAPAESEVRALVGHSAGKAVAQLVAAAANRKPATPPPGFASQPMPAARPADMRPESNQAFRREQAAHALEVKVWWFREMLGTPHPLAERMVLFWHNHFATSQQKVIRAHAMWRQHQLLRQHALGNFRAMLHAVGKDPAMLVYLDGAQSRKEAPNENFAREVMELFTLGQDSRAYTEQDIKEAARAFTGWSVERDDFSFRWRPFFHDAGVKTIFGQSGAFDGDAVLDLLLDSARVKGAASRFIVGKLWREFVSPEPDKVQLARIANQFEQSGYDITVALRELLLCPQFWSADNRGSLIKSPVELIVGTMRQLGIQTDDPTALVLKSAQLGQNLLLPPNVKGWPGYTEWINATTLLERKRFLEQMFRVAQQNPRSRAGADPAMNASMGSAMTSPAMRMQDLRREFGEKGVGTAQRELNQLQQVMGPQGVARVAQSVQSLVWDAQAFLQVFGAWPDREPGIESKRQLQLAMLAAEPTQPIAAGTVGWAHVRALTQDAAYQVK